MAGAGIQAGTGWRAWAAGVAAWTGLVGPPAAAAEPIVLRGHAADVFMALFTPDGGRVVTASADETARLWDAATGAELRRFVAHTGAVSCLAVSGDGRTLVTGGQDNTVRVWGLPLPAPRTAVAAHPVAATALLVLPDDRGLVTAGGNMVRIWNGEALTTLPAGQAPAPPTVVERSGHTAPVLAAAASPDGATFVSADESGRMLLWSPLLEEPLGTLGLHDGGIAALALHPDGKRLLSAGLDGTLRVWALPPQPPRIAAAPAAPIRDVAASPNQPLAVVAHDDAVRVVDTRSLAMVREFPRQPAAVNAVAVTADGGLLALADEQGSVRLFRTADGADAGRVAGHGGAIHDVAFLPDGKRFVTGGADGTLRAWTLPTPPVPLDGHTGTVLAMASAPSGQWCVSAADDKTVRLWNPAGQTVRAIGTHAAAVPALAISPDEKALVTGDAAGTLAVWGSADGAALGAIVAHRAGVRALAHDTSAPAVWSAGGDGLLKRWRLPLVPPKPLPGHSQPIRAAAVSADGRVAVTGGQDQSVRLRDGADGRETRLLGTPPAGPVAAVAANRDGSLVAALTDTGSLRVWKSGDGAVVLDRLLPGGAGSDVTFVGPGLVATVGQDDAIRLWNPAAVPEAAPPPESAPPQATAVSGDSARVAVAGPFGGRPTVIVRGRADGQVLGTFTGPTAPIAALALSRGGDHVACGAGPAVFAWKTAGGEPRSVDGLAGAVVALALADDGASCFLATGDAVVRHWSLAEARELRQFAGHAGAVRHLVLEGGRLHSGADDGSVITWDVATGGQLRAVSLGAAIRALDVAPNGRVAAASAARTLKLWTPGEPAEPLALPPLPQDVTGLRWSPDGAALAVSATDAVRILQADGLPLETHATPAVACSWRPDGRGLSALRADGVGVPFALAVTQALVPPDPQTRLLAAAPDGTLLVASGAGKRLLVWRIEKDRLASPAPLAIGAGAARVTDLAFAADSSRVAAACEDGRVAVWGAASLQTAEAPPTVAFAHGGPVRGVTLVAAGNRVAVAADDGVAVYDVATGKEAERFAPPTAQGVVVATGAGTLLTGGADGVAYLWTSALERLLPLGDAPTDLCSGLAPLPGGGVIVQGSGAAGLRRFGADGSPGPPLLPDMVPVRLATSVDGLRLVAVDAAGGMRAWRSDDGTVAGPFPLGSGVTALALVRDGTQVVVADTAPRLRAFSTEDGSLVEELATPTPLVTLAVSGTDGRSWLGFGSRPQGSLQQRTWTATWVRGGAAVRAVAATPDGTRCFAGLADGEIRQIATADGAAERTLAASGAAVHELALDAGAARLGAAGDDGVRVWSLADGTVARTLGAARAARHVAFGAAAGGRVATSDAEGVVRLWDAASAAPVESFPLHRGGTAPVRWQADGVTLVSGGRDGRLASWQGGGLVSVRVADLPLRDLALNGGNQVFVSDDGGAVRVVDLGTASVPRTLAEGLVPPLTLVQRPDQQRLAVGSGEGTVRIVEPATGRTLQSLEAGAPVTALAWRADGQRLSAGTRGEGASPPRVVVFGPPATPEPGRELERHDAATAGADVRRLGFDRDGRDVWGVLADGTLARFAPAAPLPLFKLDHGGPVLAVVVSRDGQTVVSGGTDLTVRVWDAATGQQRAQMGGHTGAVHALAFTPDEAFVVSAGADRTLRLWDVAGGRQLKQLATTEETVYAVAVHPDARTVAAGGADRSVHLVNLVSGATERTLSGHPDFVHGVAFNPAGTTLLSYGYAGQLRIWGLAAAAPLLETRVGRIGNFAAFDRVGERVVLANGDGTATVVGIPAAAR